MPHRIFVVAEEISSWQDRLGPVDGVPCEVVPRDTKIFLFKDGKSTPLDVDQSVSGNEDVTGGG